MALEFLVRNQRLKLFSGGPVVADSQQYLKARFTFSEDWQGTRKYAQFRRDGEVYTCNIDEYGEVEVPWETLVGKGVVQISAFATNQQDETNKLITTNPVFVKVETSGIKETELPKTPSLGILGNSVDESLKEITDARDRYVLQMTEIRDVVLEAKDHIDQTDYKIYVGETEPSEDITNAVVWINPNEDDGGSDELAEAVTAAQNAANTAEKIATDLGLVDEAVQTAVASAEQASDSATIASNKADIATTKADIATAKASEASTSAATATAKADAASTSATNAAQSYTNADAIATQLTEYLATKETLTAPAVDKTLLIEGAAADSKVVGELKSDLNELEVDVEKLGYTSKNLYNPTTDRTGKIINSSTGVIEDNSNYKISDYIYVGDVSSICIQHRPSDSTTGCITIFTYTDNNENSYFQRIYATDNNNGSFKYDVDTNVKYIVLGMYNASEPFMVNYGTELMNYSEYGSFITGEELKNILSNKTSEIVVALDGTGDYTSFTKAIYETVDSGVPVIVKRGNYNIVNEYIALFGSDVVNNLSDSTDLNGFQYGVRITNRKVTFLSGSHLVCDWSGYTVNSTHRFCPIRVDCDAELIGLDLYAKGTFYAVHDDYGGNTPYTNIYRFCRIIGEDLYNANCIGGGCGKYSRHILENCYFDNNSDKNTLRYHNSLYADAEPEIYMSNCFANNSINFNYLGNHTTKMKVYINNCKASVIEKKAESADYTVDNVELYEWNNTTGLLN